MTSPRDRQDPQAELEHLRERNQKLAEDRAHLQLILRLIEKLDPLPGLEDLVRSLLLTIVECIGGTNIKLYYWIGEELHYRDFLGASRRLPAIDDPDVARVAETRTFLEERRSTEETLLKDGVLRGSWTWTFPLLVGPKLVGIAKLENLHLHGATLGKYLPIFFSHAALILGNEIRTEASRRADAELRVATERLRLATEAGLIGIWDWDVKRDELVWDAAMYRLYGRREGDFGGAYEAWIRAVHPDDEAYADAEIQAALRGEREYAPEFRVVWPDGSIHHIKAASRTLRDEAGEPVRMVGINYDLTERKRAEESLRRLNRELRALGRCNEALLRAEDEPTLLEQVCRIVCDEAGYRMAWVGIAEHDEARSVRPAAWAGAEDGYLAASRVVWSDTERGRGPVGTAIRTGETVVLEDFATVPAGAPWRADAVARGYRSLIALPLADGGGRTFGALAIYSTEPGGFAPQETHLLQELAGDLAFGISVLRARAELARAEAERRAHLRFLEAMDRVNRAIQGARELDELMRGVLDVVLSTFGCDRVFLMVPCDPAAASVRIPMERSRPEHPGAAPGTELPVDPHLAEAHRLLLASEGPLAFGEGAPRPLRSEIAASAGIRSLLAMALHPKIGPPWQLGLLQRSQARTWTAEEERLLQEIGRRLADGLTSLLAYGELRESEEKLARAERIVHVGYWDRDLVAGRITLSAEGYRIFGLDPARPFTDLAPWHETWRRLLHPHDRERAARAYTDALAGGPRYDVEYRIVRPSGEIRFIHSQADVTRDAAGQAVRILGTMQDVTERRRAEDEIRELNQRLEQRVAARTAELAAANRELEAFAYSVSHDLRAPLRAIDGYRGLLERKVAGQLDAQGRRYLDSISESATRMGQLIDDLLSFSRMGRLEMSRLRVDLAGLVREVVAELSAEEPARGVAWRVGELPAVSGDRAMLRVVLVNLLSNALKFSRPRERAEIEIGSRRGDGETVVFVRDNGVGFDMAYVDKLFGVFQRLHRMEEFPGTGIGLANVRRVVARHGGRTWAEGAVGGGATFYFSLPDHP